MSAFSIAKWYLDCVDDDGNFAIAYRARLAWKKIALTYVSVMTATESRERFLSIEEPAIDGDVLTWNAAPLNLNVTMRRRTPAYEESLIDGVRWRCEMPSADAEMNGLRGNGYAELLQLDVAPWKLPIDELRWGRFIGAEVAMTWIEWRGPHPLKRTLINGVRNDDHEFSPYDERIIRDAHLGDTLSIPGVVLPRRIARTREVKWCARGTVSAHGRILDRGWAVYETVTFP